MILITSVFILGLASLKIALLGFIGIVIGIITLFDVLTSGEVIMGYAYNMSGATPILEKIVEVSTPIQMLALIVIVFTVFFTLASTVKSLGG